MSDVTLITPIGRSFWRKLDGSMDAGYSYTRSSGVSQLNLNLNSVYRQPKAESRLTASFTQTQTEDEAGADDRGTVEICTGASRGRDGRAPRSGDSNPTRALGSSCGRWAAPPSGPDW